ncbi:MAG: hypothetical protein DCC55_12335 [Chloroflexi bacterium]|nr:MAG: hypothetical protein DCC55_12335 [Chloroflexota bacterium]
MVTVSTGNRGSTTASVLTLADATALSDPGRFPDLALVAPQYGASATLTRGASEGSYQVVGTTEAYAAVRNLESASGTFLTAEQVAENAKVVVLGATVASDLFGGQDPLRQILRINDALVEVTGVLASTGGAGFGSSDTQVFVPSELALGRLFNVNRIRGSYAISGMSIQVVS